MNGEVMDDDFCLDYKCQQSFKRPQNILFQMKAKLAKLLQPMIIHMYIGWQNLNLLSHLNATIARQARASGENFNYVTLAPQARPGGEI